MERNAFAEACNRLTAAEIKQIVGNIHSYKSWLLKKHKNMKNGERTPPVIKGLMKCLVTKKSNALEMTESQESSADKPAKAEEVSASSSSKPEMADEMQIGSPKSAKAAAMDSPSPKPAKAAAQPVILDFATPKNNSPGAKSVLSVSSSDVVPASNMCPGCPEKACCKGPERHEEACKGR